MDVDTFDEKRFDDDAAAAGLVTVGGRTVVCVQGEAPGWGLL